MNDCQQAANDKATRHYERFKDSFLGSWERVHGEEARAKLEEENERGLMNLWASQPTTTATPPRRCSTASDAPSWTR